MSLSPADFLTQLLEHTGLQAGEFSVDEKEEKNTIFLTINAPESESGILIGVHGETLSSLQRITRLSFMSSLPDTKIVININDYRQKREEKLKSLIETVAQRVLTTGQSHTFPTYFPSYERFFIHTFLGDNEKFKDLESVSSGLGRDRRLTIQLKNQAS